MSIHNIKTDYYDKTNRYTYANDYPASEPYSISTELRLTNLEKRLENTEKMLKFYEEMLRLKDEEKRNELAIDQNKILELSKKVSILEENLIMFHKKLYELNNLMIEKFELLDKKIMRVSDDKINISDFYANKFSEIEGMLNRNNIYMENLIIDKIEESNGDFSAKLDDVLSLITEMGKLTERNENHTNELKESIRLVQNDHLSFVKIITILKEKAETLDYIMTQIADLKQRYNKIIGQSGED
jgi:hypothetical protein